VDQQKNRTSSCADGSVIEDCRPRPATHVMHLVAAAERHMGAVCACARTCEPAVAGSASGQRAATGLPSAQARGTVMAPYGGGSDTLEEVARLQDPILLSSTGAAIREFQRSADCRRGGVPSWRPSAPSSAAESS